MARSYSWLHRLTIRWSGSRARIRLPSLRHRTGVFDGVENDQEVEFLRKAAVEEELVSSEAGGGGGGGNRVMVVVDSSVEAKWALEWAISHAVRVEDTIVLLHVGKPKKSVSNGKQSARVKDLLQSMKNKCQNRNPGVRVELVMVEGKEKGPVIVEAAKRHKASLLVLGQRTSWMIWQLLKRWAWKGGHGGDCSSSEVDYCIQNASCMTIAARKMSNELGGYLITTRHHKNFWLLA
ncbi:hypothetical protein SLE2022_299150 [Rubroshorea leprosula]